MSIEKVQNKLWEELKEIPEVVAISCSSESEGCITVFATNETKDVLKMVPKAKSGYKVIIKTTSAFKAFDK